jgi:GxxExxY protein
MEMQKTTEFVYAELTKVIIGALFEVHNNLGSGLLEKHYQRALAEEFKRRGIVFVEQYPIKLQYKEVEIGRYLVDFLIENKIILEIKRNEHFSRDNIEQTLNYLKALNLQLGLLVHFGKSRVVFKRIVNLY